jgi:hypothetical protein
MLAEPPPLLLPLDALEPHALRIALAEPAAMPVSAVRRRKRAGRSSSPDVLSVEVLETLDRFVGLVGVCHVPPPLLAGPQLPAASANYASLPVANSQTGRRRIRQGIPSGHALRTPPSRPRADPRRSETGASRPAAPRAHRTDRDRAPRQRRRPRADPLHPRRAAPRSVSELRFNELRGEEVVYAIHRQERTFLPAREHCPL